MGHVNFSSFESRSRLSGFFFPLFSSSCLFSTPLRDAYITHQPCDLEPPLCQCILRLAKSTQNCCRRLPKTARQYLFVFVATMDGQVCLEKRKGALVTDRREGQASMYKYTSSGISGVFGVYINTYLPTCIHLYTLVPPLTDE